MNIVKIYENNCYFCERIRKLQPGMIIRINDEEGIITTASHCTHTDCEFYDNCRTDNYFIIIDYGDDRSEHCCEQDIRRKNGKYLPDNKTANYLLEIKSRRNK